MNKTLHASCIALLTLVLAAGCSNTSVDGPSVVPPNPPGPLTPTPGPTSAQVNLLRAATGAPGIANPVVRFYAKLGEDREAFMYYKARASGRDSTVFVRFRVPKRALFARPNGVLFATGDSI